MQTPMPEITSGIPRASTLSDLLGSFSSANMDSTMSARFASSVLLSGVVMSCIIPMVFSSSVSAFWATTLSSFDNSLILVFTFSMLHE